MRLRVACVPQEDGQVEAALSEWREEIERTLAVLQNVLPTELRDTYLSTALEQEVHNTVCMSQVQRAGYRVQGSGYCYPPVEGSTALPHCTAALHWALCSRLPHIHCTKKNLFSGVVAPVFEIFGAHFESFAKMFTTPSNAFLCNPQNEF